MDNLNYDEIFEHLIHAYVGKEIKKKIILDKI